MRWAALLVLAFPLFVQAASSGPTFASWVDSLQKFVDTAIVPLLYVLAFFFFIFGIVRYFFMGGEENREKGRTFVFWGLIGMVAIFSIWGVVRLLLSLIPGT